MPNASEAGNRDLSSAVAFILGAVIGGLLAGWLGGILGAGLALAARAALRSSLAPGLRILLTLVILAGGFSGLWVAAGFVRAALGLIAAGRLAR